MSSHREAPEIAKDPVADNTDVYAFVSSDRPDTVTMIANFIPLEPPAGGPNFYEFGDDVRYAIHIDNNGDAAPDISYYFRFRTEVRNPDTFLYNTGPITSLDSPNWNRRQFYRVNRVSGDDEPDAGQVVSGDIACPPCNIGPRSTPNYPALAAAAIHSFGDGGQVFAGQRAEGFYVDLGAVFDLGGLRPFNQAHLIKLPVMAGIDATKLVNVHTIAIQVPISQLTRHSSRSVDATQANAVIGVWAAAYRRKVTVRNGGHDEILRSGPWVQVSRLGNPLFNEVIVPMGKKDLWNALPPKADGQFLEYVQHPELARLIPVLYPGVFPHLAALSAARADLVAILLTGLPAGIIPHFQNFTGPRYADMLRLNVAIPPTVTNPNIYGILGGDLAGFPNGRRVFDDVVTIELRAIAGATYPLVNHAFVPDGAATAVTDGVTPANLAVPYLSTFPYLGTPSDGYDVPSS